MDYPPAPPSKLSKPTSRPGFYDPYETSAFVAEPQEESPATTPSVTMEKRLGMGGGPTASGSRFSTQTGNFRCADAAAAVCGLELRGRCTGT